MPSLESRKETYGMASMANRIRLGFARRLAGESSRRSSRAWITAWLVLAGCSSHAAPAPATPPRAVCLADELPRELEVRASWTESRPPEVTDYSPCVENPTPCEAACDRSIAAACFWLAIHHQAAGHVALENELFRKSCLLGFGVACTNFGAGLTADGASEADLQCGARIFERVCAAGEMLWGCGMYGMALARGEGVAPDAEHARAVLEPTCESAGGFSCIVLAGEIANGRIPPKSEDEVEVLSQRACDTGYEEACP